jgi:16S rRNA (guanine527-N7)-methyltransferase
VTGDPVGAIVNLAVRAHPGIAEPALHAFLTEVLRWNGQVGLVSRRDPIAACERLVLESLELLALVRTHAGDGPHRVADIGSGGGFPGLVWAIAVPGWSFLLIERQQSRASFLQVTSIRLRLESVAVFAGPAAEASHRDAYHHAFDVAVAMAVGSPQKLAPDVDALLAARGWFFGTAPAEADMPAMMSKKLERVGDAGGQFGRYGVYRQRPDAPAPEGESHE